MTKYTKEYLKRVEKAKYNWRHNSLIGTAALMRTHLKRIRFGESVPQITKAKANAIDILLKQLEHDLRTKRREPDGLLKQLKRKDNL